MLPDYPRTKNLIAEAYKTRIEAVAKSHMSVFAEVPATQMHEGACIILTRGDGSTDRVEPKKMEAGASIPGSLRDVSKVSLQQVFEMLDSLAIGLATEKLTVFMQSMHEAVHKIGNVTTPGLPPVEMFFEMMEKRFIDFEDDGSLGKTQALVGSKEAGERLLQTMQEIESNPDLRQRYEAMIEKKREEWRVREAARNLVE